MYNPLFIYGKSGLGKTHLMHAIGNYIKENSRKKVLYVTTDTFVNDFLKIYRKMKIIILKVSITLKKNIAMSMY